MSGDDRNGPPGGRYADSVPNPRPAEPRDWLPFVAGAVAVVCATWAVFALVDRAWLDCAGELEAGGRFAIRFDLFVLVLPATVLATTLAAAIPAIALRNSGVGAQVVASGMALALVVALALVLAVPHPFKGYPDDLVGGGEMAPQCGPGGLPTWWPAWLPSRSGAT